jgi:hypothetical protein
MAVHNTKEKVEVMMVKKTEARPIGSSLISKAVRHQGTSAKISPGCDDI